MSFYRTHLSIFSFLVVSLLFLSGVSATQAAGTDYYVHAGVGDNSNSGLAPDDAFNTLFYAMKRLRPGDTLYLRDGVYTDGGHIRTSTGFYSGTQALPITITSYPDENPIISSPTWTIGVIGLKWWVFEDLTFENSKALVFGNRNLLENKECIWSENMVVRNVRFQHSSNDGIRISCGKSIKIENNLFDNLRSRLDGRDAFGIMMTHQADDIKISGNNFSDIGGDGIQILDSESASYTNIEISDNEFMIRHPYVYRNLEGSVDSNDPQKFGSVGENAVDIKEGPGPMVISGNVIHGFRPTVQGQDASGSSGEGIVLHNDASGVVITNNYFHDNVRHIVVGNQNDKSADRLNRNTVIKNNIFKDVLNPAGVYENSNRRVASLLIGDVDILNNTFYQTADDQYYLLYLYRLKKSSLINNIFKNGVVLLTGTTDHIVNNNAWSEITGEMDPDLIGSNDVNADSLSFDWNSWTPFPTSPLINGGVNVGLTEDYNGDPIVGLPDIGAVEYQPPAPPSPTPTGGVVNQTTPKPAPY